MSRPDREALLLRWATSRLALRRSAFRAFRKLLTCLAYADPGTPEEPNRLLRAMGYGPDRPPVTAEPTRVRAWEAFEARLAAMDFGPNRGGVFSAHHMGSLRMGADAADHPADPRGHVRRDARGVNPMVGIMAMAKRVSRTVLAAARSS